MTDDTGEYMLGDIAVTVVLMESDPTAAPPGVTPDANTENWSPSLIAEVKTKVDSALDWWKTSLEGVSPAMAADLHFHVDYTYADSPVRTYYEPINRPSGDFRYWMYDFLKVVDYDQSGDFSQDIRAFNDAQRQKLQSHWGFTIFVVNSTVDVDDGFATGGFPRAFAYAGGRFAVVPSGRPTSSYAHEIGHMFWARDEYAGEDWLSRRGYYNTQNLNAPHTGYTQLPSLMASNSLLDQAFATHTSAPSTFAMIGWQDSDGDGIFDVLDVPLSLTGSGYYQASSGTYRFRGSSAVRTLPNLNSSGLQNDITINVVGRAEYRVDGGAWTTAATYGTYSANLDLAFAVPAGSHVVEVRTIDPDTGVTSAIFQGTTDRPTTLLSPGISGFVFSDGDGDAQFDNTEQGWAGWQVELVGAGGTPLNLQKTLEPDQYATNTSITQVLPGVRLSSIGWNSNGTVVSLTGMSSTGTRGIGTYSVSNRNYTNAFSSEALQLRIDFDTPTSFVSIDAIGSSGLDYGRLEAFDSAGNILARYTTRGLESLQVETMSLQRDSADIAYVLVKSHQGTEIALDNLRVGPTSSVVTDSSGAFHLPTLPAGTYTLQVVPPATWAASGTVPAPQSLTVGEGEAAGMVDFAARGGRSPWHNASRPWDVDGNGTVEPRDALLVVNDLNTFGARVLGSGDLTPPYLDVNNDGQIGPIDALLIVNELNDASAAGEGPASPTTGSPASGLPQGEDPAAAIRAGSIGVTPTASPTRPLSIRDFLASSYRFAAAPQSVTTPSATSPVAGSTSASSADEPDFEALARDVAVRWASQQDDDEHHHHDDEQSLDDHDHDHDGDHAGDPSHADLGI
ncbi:MAG: dockerin type I domain-containing protein [Pirellulales bacterium]